MNHMFRCPCSGAPHLLCVQCSDVRSSSHCFIDIKVIISHPAAALISFDFPLSTFEAKPWAKCGLLQMFLKQLPQLVDENIQIVFVRSLLFNIMVVCHCNLIIPVLKSLVRAEQCVSETLAHRLR